MSQLNHFICPKCGHDFYNKCAYATCDACNTFFYAAQSLTCNVNKPFIPRFNITVNGKPWQP